MRGGFIHDLESLACGEEETNSRSSFLACDPTLPVLRERVPGGGPGQAGGLAP